MPKASLPLAMSMPLAVSAECRGSPYLSPYRGVPIPVPIPACSHVWTCVPHASQPPATSRAVALAPEPASGRPARPRMSAAWAPSAGAAHASYLAAPHACLPRHHCIVAKRYAGFAGRKLAAGPRPSPRRCYHRSPPSLCVHLPSRGPSDPTQAPPSPSISYLQGWTQDAETVPLVVLRNKNSKDAMATARPCACPSSIDTKNARNTQLQEGL
jgi:hypothetical protein